MDTPILLGQQHTVATEKNKGFPKLCSSARLPPLLPSSLPPVCDTSGEFMLNHIVVIQAAFGCLLSVSPIVVFPSKWWLLFLDTGVFGCESLCVFLCVMPS